MASRANTTRYALATYAVVLVLPTLIVGFLYWDQLQREYQAQLDAVPEEAEAVARRLVENLRADFEDLLENEQRRPFYEYADEYAYEDRDADTLTVLPSPLVREGPRIGILAWFSWEIDEQQGRIPEIHVFRRRAGDGEALPGGNRRERALEGLDEALQLLWMVKDTQPMADRLDGIFANDPQEVNLAVAAVAYGQGRNLDCVRPLFDEIKEWEIWCEVSDFGLDFFMDDTGVPHAFASRSVMLYWDRSDVPTEADCLVPFTDEGSVALRQGFALDVEWLFSRRPRALAREILREDQQLVDPESEFPLSTDRTRFAQVLPAAALGFRVADEDELAYGQLEIESDTTIIHQRYRRSLRRFFGVGLLLVVTLMTGMRLLYLNVRRELDQAHRMQNFVAAVTHELRTPLSAIRLHGEMLLDGWASDPAKQRDYYKRILRETERLSTLVERVLEKSRLKEDRVVPQPGDLNEAIESIVPGLEAPEGGFEDLVIELEPDLPPVLMTQEAVAGILLNIVENARKYAPVVRGQDPILVRTRRERDRVVLEVADRGPGVPATEKERIFDAFYRSGAESTRKTIGTGLGLHLVQLHAASVGGRASVLDRQGGGSLFRVAFRPAS